MDPDRDRPRDFKDAERKAPAVDEMFLVGLPCDFLCEDCRAGFPSLDFDAKTEDECKADAHDTGRSMCVGMKHDLLFKSAPVSKNNWSIVQEIAVLDKYKKSQGDLPHESLNMMAVVLTCFWWRPAEDM